VFHFRIANFSAASLIFVDHRSEILREISHSFLNCSRTVNWVVMYTPLLKAASARVKFTAALLGFRDGAWARRPEKR
jgi:hypothetical protein